MLVKLLSLTEVGKVKIVGAVKAIRNFTGAGSITTAKRAFDMIRGGQFVTLPLQPQYKDPQETELPKYFNLEGEEDISGVERLMRLLTDANQVALDLGFREEHDALVAMMRGLYDKTQEGRNPDALAR